MSIWDDFKEAVSDVWDAGAGIIEDLSEATEEAVEEVAAVVIEEILGLDDISGGGSDGGSDGHDHDADFGDNASGLQIADLADILVTSVKDAQSAPDFLNWFSGDMAFGTVDDIVTEPDSTHVFDDVAGPLGEIVTTIDTIPGVPAGDVQDADTTTDTFKFLDGKSKPSDAPSWTNGLHADPGSSLLQLPPFLASSLFSDFIEQPDLLSGVPMPVPGDFAVATTLDEASPTMAASVLLS